MNDNTFLAIVKSTGSKLTFGRLRTSSEEFGRLQKTSDFFGNVRKWSCRLKKSQHSQDKNLTLISQKKLAGILKGLTEGLPAEGLTEGLPPPHHSMVCCYYFELLCLQETTADSSTLNVGERRRVWIVLFSKVTPFEHSVSTNLSPIIVSIYNFK